MSETRFHTLPDGRRIAFRHLPGTGPALVFLPGYMSDMAGTKAQALWDWAGMHGRECLLLDYSGCGESEGLFADGTLSRWNEEVLALIRAQVAGRVVLVGSSMGGWLMVLAARELGDRVAALVGIAAAPDFTHWGYSDTQKQEFAAGQTVFEESAYGPEPTPTYAAFWHDGEAHRVLATSVVFTGPVRLLHGMDDSDVPPEISLKLAAALGSPDVQVTLVKHGDHRLSRDSDLALLTSTVAALG